MLPALVEGQQLFHRVRGKPGDKHARVLAAMAREVNQVWNFCNETSRRAIRKRHQWLSGYDLQKLTNGYSKCDGIHIGSPTVQQVCEDYAKARKQFKKAKLRWRVSNPKAANTAWAGFRSRPGLAIQSQGKSPLRARNSACGTATAWRTTSYAQAASARTAEALVSQCGSQGAKAKGQLRPRRRWASTLGLKEAAVASNGQRIEGRFYRKLEADLVSPSAPTKAARQSHPRKIANQRKDALHKFSTALVQENAAIFVGDVASSKLVKTKMAKSTLDAGWAI